MKFKAITFFIIYITIQNVKAFLNRNFKTTINTFKMYDVMKPRVEFEYCTGCRWLLRSAWMTQEILTTFEKEIGEVALIPCKETPGTFIVRLDGTEIWNRKVNDGFPDIKELKQLVRDKINPDKSLGHSDKIITL